MICWTVDEYSATVLRRAFPAQHRPSRLGIPVHLFYEFRRGREGLDISQPALEVHANDPSVEVAIPVEKVQFD